MNRHPRSRSTRTVIAARRAQNTSPRIRHRLEYPVEPGSPGKSALERMTLSRLCAHFTNTAHVHMRCDLARLTDKARQFSAQVGASAPWIKNLRRRIAIVRAQITAHLRTESGSLFPLLQRLETVGAPSAAERKALRGLLTQMRKQHNKVDEALSTLAALLDDHLATAATPTEQQPLLMALRRLENRLQEQIYRENHILFQRAAALAQIG